MRCISSQDSFLPPLTILAATSGARVLELGAGNGLPGVVGARCGATVWLSDMAEAEGTLDNCRRTCAMNGVDARGGRRVGERGGGKGRKPEVGGGRG